MTKLPERARFRALSDATGDDWAVLERGEARYRDTRGPGAGLLSMLEVIAGGDSWGAPVNLYTHCLQTATRVAEAGLDDELVVLSLFHDLPEAFSDNHHGLLAAEMLAPWLSERRRWVLIHHVEFQALHFANHPTRDRDERDHYRGHPYFDETADFCARYDQNSFDPDFRTGSLADFTGIVRRFFSGPAPRPVRLTD